MSGHAFRPSVARVQNAQKIFTSTKTNATIRDLEEEEGELEEKEGTVVSIKRDLINGSGWTVKDKKDEQIYVCSCASSMYEVPETVERGGILYPKDTIEVTFTVNPVLRINTIKEIKSLGEETEALDISEWTHKDESTTVIAKPKSALSISNGFIQLNYNNDNKVLASPDGVKTKGKKTSIETEKLEIKNNDVTIGGAQLTDMINDAALNVSNEYIQRLLDSPITTIKLERTNNITQIDIEGDYVITNNDNVIGHIKDQKSIPTRTLSQRLITDGDCVDTVTIDEDGIIYINSTQNNKCERNVHIQSLTQWITPQIESRNYIKVKIKKFCTNCGEKNDGYKEYINYCPVCGNWNYLIDTTESVIKCTICSSTFCENCGTGISNTSLELEEYDDSYITGEGTTCHHCNTQLSSGTNKYYVNYCPDCRSWHCLTSYEYEENGDTINAFTCTKCGHIYCCTCGISQTSYGLNLGTKDNPTQYDAYKNAFRRLKYIKG